LVFIILGWIKRIWFFVTFGWIKRIWAFFIILGCFFGFFLSYWYGFFGFLLGMLGFFCSVFNHYLWDKKLRDLWSIIRFTWSSGGSADPYFQQEKFLQIALDFCWGDERRLNRRNGHFLVGAQERHIDVMGGAQRDILMWWEGSQRAGLMWWDSQRAGLVWWTHKGLD
jgi:hypothetical protein